MYSRRPIRRKLLRQALRPLELLIRLQRKLVRLILNNSELSGLQEVGERFQCGEGLSIQNSGVMTIGSDFSGANNLQLSTYSQGELRMGDRCFVGDNCKIISDNGKIAIGDDCLIAEQVTIRASNHGTEAGQTINRQPNVCQSITIGSDVWIGKGTAILAGATVADGVVIGANSIVLGSSVTEPNCIYAGSPIRKIRPR